MNHQLEHLLTDIQFSSTPEETKERLNHLKMWLKNSNLNKHPHNEKISSGIISDATQGMILILNHSNQNRKFRVDGVKDGQNVVQNYELNNPQYFHGYDFEYVIITDMDAECNCYLIEAFRGIVALSIH